MKIILASASPRRKELMSLVSENFEIIPADIDEALPDNIRAEESAEYLACMKAEHIGRQHKGAVTVGCDTVVVCDGIVMGKPADEKDAERMLSALSGKAHKVITGVCLYSDNVKRSFSQVTEVEFYPLSEKEIADYVSSGEPMDKAGAYGIQGLGSLLVKGINGDYFNVVGLPAARLKRELDEFMCEIAK